jgi:hypothetical protein
MRFLCYTIDDPNAPLPEPTPQLFEEMGKFMEEATKAGALVAAGGVGPLDSASKVSYDGTDFTVLDGPFTEAKELVGGFWILEVASREEAVTWARRAPLGAGSILEVRRVVEASDFEGIAPQEVLDAEEVLRERTAERLRERGEGPQG